MLCLSLWIAGWSVSLAYILKHPVVPTVFESFHPAVEKAVLAVSKADRESCTQLAIARWKVIAAVELHVAI